MAGERASHGDALLLAAGKLMRVVVELRREPSHVQDVRQRGPDLLARSARNLQGVGDVVVDGACRQQLEVLEDDTDVAPVIGNLLALDFLERAPGDVPSVGSSSLISSRMIVDLPEPVAPTRNTISRRLTANVARSRPMPPGP
jgi:hypothetical protein